MLRSKIPPVLFKLLAVAGFTLLLTACGDSSGDTQPGQTETSDSSVTTETTATTATSVPPTTLASTTSTALEPTTTLPPVERVVNVYWLRDTQIAVGGRVVEAPAIAAAALAELLAGPNELEADLDMVSAMPAGAEVLGLTIVDGVATVDFSSGFEATGLGSTGEIGLVSQVVFTLTQFSSVDTVNITIEGEVREAILSHGLMATGLTREDFLDAVAPAILVESPYPGQVVSSPLTVTGISRTFESTFVYLVTTPPNDEIVDEGFTTASQPDVHLFGPFEFTVEFNPAVAGFGSVIVFEESAQDGSQINIYEVPVRMEP